MLGSLDIIRESGWDFISSGGGSISVSTPIARVGVEAGGGVMYVRRQRDGKEVTLGYGGIGGSLGLSLIPSPINITFALPEMPAAGRVYMLPAALRELTEDEFRGAMILIEAGADWTVGVSGALMFIGGSLGLAAPLLAAGPLGMSAALFALLASSKACASFGGMSVTLLPVNAGVSVSVGMIM